MTAGVILALCVELLVLLVDPKSEVIPGVVDKNADDVLAVDKEEGWSELLDTEIVVVTCWLLCGF